MNIVVIGSSNMDLVIFAPKIPSEGETILGGRSDMIFGGKGANQAIAVKRSGGDVRFIAKTGNDLFGRDMRTHFKEQGLDTKSILMDMETATGVAQIVVSDTGENAITVAPGANANLFPKDIASFKAEIQQASIVLMQLETPIETVAHVAAIVAEKKGRFILNPAPAQVLKPSLLKQVWLLTPNESETQLLTGLPITDIASAQKGAQLLLDKGVQNVIITLGAKGCVFANKNELKVYSAFEVNSSDTTAAGDVFNGALATALARGETFNQAIPFASAAAAISVTREGAQPSIPNAQEIQQFLFNQKLKSNDT